MQITRDRTLQMYVTMRKLIGWNRILNKAI